MSRLKPRDLSQLVTQPDINLGQLYNLKRPNTSSVSAQESPTVFTKDKALCSVTSLGSSLENDSEYDKHQSDYERLSSLKELNILNTKQDVLKDPELLEVLDDNELKSKLNDDDIEIKSKILEDDLNMQIAEEIDLEEDSCHESSIELEHVNYEDPSIQTVPAVIPLPKTQKKETV